MLTFSKKNSKRNIFSAEKAGKYEGHFTRSIKRATLSVLDFYDFSSIFLDHKMSLPKCVRDYLGVRGRGMNALLSLSSFAARSKYQAELVTREVND